MSKKIKTVNIIECTDKDNLQYSVTSFVDDEEGNREAEQHFLSVCRENGCEDDEDTLLEEAYFEEGTYSVVLTHSR